MTVFGDNAAVILTLTTRTEALRAARGRSACPEKWTQIDAQRRALEAALLARANACDIQFGWVARKYNALADEVCNAVMDERTPTLTMTMFVQPPEKYERPTAAEMKIVADKILKNPCDSIRSIPQSMTALWQATLARVLAWEDLSAFAFAPRVLLRKDGSDLRRKLLNLANEKDAVERAFHKFRRRR